MKKIIAEGWNINNLTIELGSLFLKTDTWDSSRLKVGRIYRRQTGGSPRFFFIRLFV